MTTKKLEAWQQVWQTAAPHLSSAGLQALRAALEDDSDGLLQGKTTDPPPLAALAGRSAYGACPWGLAIAADYGGLASDLTRDERTATVGEVEEAFARLCFEVDQALGQPAGCRWFLNWWDESPRASARLALLAEVDQALAARVED